MKLKDFYEVKQVHFPKFDFMLTLILRIWENSYSHSHLILIPYTLQLSTVRYLTYFSNHFTLLSPLWISKEE